MGGAGDVQRTWDLRAPRSRERWVALHLRKRDGHRHALKEGVEASTGFRVEHWHGAAPDQDMLQLTIYEGTVKWLEPVTDTE